MTTTTTTAAPRPDPMPAAALGMWLFLAGEAMFFAGLLTAYTVLQATPATHAVFARSAAAVNRPLTVAAVLLLAATAAVLWRGSQRLKSQLVAGGLAIAFLAVQAWAGGLLLRHRTIATASAVYDGTAARRDGSVVVTGVRSPLPPSFDPAQTLPADLRATGTPGEYTVAAADVRVDVTCGPSRNNYFACYFLVTVAHALHVVGGLAALAWLAVRTWRGSATALQVRTVALYWQFLNGVGLLAIVLLANG